MHGTELELKLCALPRRYSFISMNNSGSTFAGTGVLVCGRNADILIFFEGGLLCVESRFALFLLFLYWL